jgi:hypothetical protein
MRRPVNGPQAGPVPEPPAAERPVPYDPRRVMLTGLFRASMVTS